MFCSRGLGRNCVRQLSCFFFRPPSRVNVNVNVNLISSGQELSLASVQYRHVTETKETNILNKRSIVKIPTGW